MSRDLNDDSFLYTRWAQAQDQRRDKIPPPMTHLQKQWLQERGLEAPVEDAPDPLLVRLEALLAEVSKPTEGDTVLDHAIAWQEKSKDAAALRRVIGMLREKEECPHGVSLEDECGDCNENEP